eukprot:Rmarinus@m.21243
MVASNSVAVSTFSGVKVYNFSSGKTLPEWLKNKSKKSLKYNEDFRRRIEVIQDFQFPTACDRVKASADGQYIFATGTYPPQVRCYDTTELSMKFDRHLDHEVAQFQILSPDYQKVVFLRTDRVVEFHARYGRHFTTRIPMFGRDMTYFKETCDLYFAASGSEVYRLNLDKGQFLTPFSTGSASSSVIGINPVNNIVCVGCDDGYIECWDPRAGSRIARLNAASIIHAADGSSSSLSGEAGVTALRFFQSDGLELALGLSSGLVGVFDLRSSRPFAVRDHQHQLPIVDIKFHAGHGRGTVISADRQIMRVWDCKKHRDDSLSGTPITSVQPPHPINDVCLFGNSGLLAVAVEAPRVQMICIPALGPAPRWCSFLDSITEELEETSASQGAAPVYDDYKFVTREELEQLGVKHLIGTNLLRPYMHGFFMDYRLYQKVQAIAQPFAYEEFRKQKVREKVEEKHQNRISRVRRLPKVNRDAAARMLAEQELNHDEDKPMTALQDPRFSKMFSDTDFQINEEDEEFVRLNPHGKKKPSAHAEKELANQGFELIEESDDAASSSSEDFLPSRKGKDQGRVGTAASADDDDDADASSSRKRKRGAAEQPIVSATGADHGSEDSAGGGAHEGRRQGKGGQKKRDTKKMYEAGDEDAWLHATTRTHSEKAKKATKVSLGERLKAQKANAAREKEELGNMGVKKALGGGGVQMTFYVDDKKKDKKERKRNVPQPSQSLQDAEDANRKRRGVQDLKLSRLPSFRSRR